MGEILSFFLICIIIGGVVASILSRISPQKEQPAQQRQEPLPALPIIQPAFSQQPVNGYQQPYQTQQPQLDAFTVNYMLHLIQNQRRLTDER